MPKPTGQILRIEKAPPLQGGQVAWLTFSKLRVNLCALKSENGTVVCQPLLVPNLPFGQIRMHQDDNLNYGLKYRYSAPEEVPTAHLQTYVNGFGAEIAHAKAALEKKLANPKENMSSLIGSWCFGWDEYPDDSDGDCGGGGVGDSGGGGGDSGGGDDGDSSGGGDEGDNSNDVGDTNDDNNGNQSDPGPIQVGNPACVAGCIVTYQRASSVCNLIPLPQPRLICQGGVAAIYLACYYNC